MYYAMLVEEINSNQKGYLQHDDNTRVEMNLITVDDFYLFFLKECSKYCLFNFSSDEEAKQYLEGKQALTTKYKLSLSRVEFIFYEVN
jgi:hypothetical protein